MTAFVRLLRWELAICARDRAVWSALAALLLAAGLATWNGHAVATSTFDAVADARTMADATRVKLLGRIETGEAGASAPTNARFTPIRPAPPLAGIAGGRIVLDPLAGEGSATVPTHRLFRDYQSDNPWIAASGAFDWAFVIAVLLPLLIVALGAPVLAADRDSGRDRLVALAGGGEGRLLAARLAARAIWLSGPALLLLGCANVALADPSAPDLAARIALLLGVAILGMAFWWGAVAWIGRCGHGAAPTAAILVALWATLALAVPTLSAALAEIAAPPPSRIVLTAEARAAEVRAQSGSAVLVGRYLTDHPELEQNASADPRIAERYAVALEIDRAASPALARFEAVLAQQHAIERATDLLSPVALQRALFADLAGTGEPARAAFARASALQFGAWRDRVGALIVEGKPLDPARLAGLPSFAAPPTPWPPIWTFVALGVSALIPFALAWRRAWL